MKAISLWQPWASLWCSARKIHETRHWPTGHRGWLLVHAAKRKPDADLWDTPVGEICDDEFGNHWGIDLPFGAIVGKVNIIACRRTEDVTEEYRKDKSPKPPGQIVPDDYLCGNFAPGRYAWQRSEFICFRDPIPYRGAQGMFNVPDPLVREALAA